MLGFHNRAIANDDGALQGIAHFADIARPGVVLKRVQHRLAHPADFSSVLVIHVGQQCLDQFRDVFFMLAQRGHVDVENVESIIKIVAQLASRHGFLGNLVGCGQNADIDRGLHFAAQPAQLAVLEHAQQFGLRGHRHLADLIEQQGSTFRQFKTSGTPLQRSGECAFFVTEYFALDQAFPEWRHS